MTTLDLDAIAAAPPEVRAGFIASLSPRQQRAYEAALLEQVGTMDPLAHLGWEDWNQVVAPRFFNVDYADCHREFWEWFETIEVGVAPDPFLELWPRGIAKSTTAEMGVAKLGCKALRKYGLYVSHTQDQADDHVGNIAAILESEEIAEHYPAMGSVLLNKTGSSKGWRRNRIRTASGFTIDALGLDVAARGAKLEENRPDILVLDDIDATHASSRVVEKNIRTITQALLPALTPNAVVILAQNLVAQNSIAARIHDGRADMFAGAVKSGPFPAVEGMEFERQGDRYVITKGTPAWPARMGIDECERQIGLMGPIAFQIECQQDSSERPGAIWRKDEIEASRVTADQVPELDMIVVGIDPNKTGRADDAGVVVVGRAIVDAVKHAYVLADYSGQGKPSEWRDTAARAAIRHHAPVMVVEFAGLGEHAELTVKGSPLFKEAGYPVPAVREAKAKLGKKDRARPVWRLYVDDLVHHVGHLTYLENQQTSWVPDDVGSISPGGLDAVVHAITHLLIDAGGVQNMARVG